MQSREAEEPALLRGEQLEEEQMQAAQRWRQQAQKSAPENANFQVCALPSVRIHLVWPPRLWGTDPLQKQFVTCIYVTAALSAISCHWPP